MRILLSAANLCRDPYPVYPLGMSTVAGALAAAGHEVLQYDPMVHGFELIQDVIRKFRPGAIAVSIRNLDTVNSRVSGKPILETPCNLIRQIRNFTNAPVILGGPGFSLLPIPVLEMTGSDFGIIGEGERAMTELIRDLEAGRDDIPQFLRGIPGQQAVPLYQKDILDFYLRETHMIPVQTKRGCSFNCIYCTYPGLEGHSFRAGKQVLTSLSEMTDDPDVMFYFVDSVFNDPAGLFRKFLEDLKKSGRSIKYCGFISPSGLTREDSILLRETGMVCAELGIDAASDRTLKALGKDFSFMQAAKACRLLADQGIGVTNNVMFGGPGETPDSVCEGIRNIAALSPALTMIFSGIRIFPGTILYNHAKKLNMIPRGWNGLESLYYFEPGIDPETLHRTLLAQFGNSRTVIYPPNRLNTELQAIHRMGYLKFRRLRRS